MKSVLMHVILKNSVNDRRGNDAFGRYLDVKAPSNRPNDIEIMKLEMMKCRETAYGG